MHRDMAHVFPDVLAMPQNTASSGVGDLQYRSILLDGYMAKRYEISAVGCEIRPGSSKP